MQSLDGGTRGPRPARRGSASLTRQERLRLRSEFLAVQGQGWRIQSEHLLLLVLHVPGSATRVGFTVSKKVGGAVERNRVRRLLREGVRRHKAILAGEAWLVVVAKPHAATITLAQVDREIMDMGRRIRGARGRRGADRPGSGSGSRDVC